MRSGGQARRFRFWRTADGGAVSAAANDAKSATLREYR